MGVQTCDSVQTRDRRLHVYSKNETLKQKWGFGGNAPNKLKAWAVGKGSELASNLCRRHSQKLMSS